MGWKKPSWVQKVQTAASSAAAPVVKAADKVAQVTGLDKAPSIPKALQNVQTAVQKGADAVGDVVRPAAQTVAKEVGYAVNPIIGEVGLRAKQIAEDPNVKKVSDKIGDAIREIPKPNIAPLKSQDSGGEVLPYLTKIVPDAVGDVVRGGGRTVAGILTGNADKITSGAKMVGSGVVDVAKHGAMGALPFLNAATQNTDGTIGGGRRGSTVQEVDEKSGAKKGVQTTAGTPEEEGMVGKIGGAVLSTMDTVADAIKAGKEWVNKGTDTVTVKSFTTQYGNVATQRDLDKFREAEKRGDIAAMDRIRAEMKAKQRGQ